MTKTKTSTTWFKTNSYSDEITTVQVVIFTDKTITHTHGRRSNRIGDWQCFFPTAEEAINYKVSRLNAEVESAQYRLNSAEKSLNEFLRMRDSGKVVFKAERD